MPKNLDLQFRESLTVRQENQAMSFGGLNAERVVLGGALSYEYQSVAVRPYLAIHDIDLRDGEICIDNSPPEHVTDLASRMTFAPRDCPLKGWASTRERVNAFTSITFDEDLLAREFEDIRRTPLEKPVVHFRDPRLEVTMWKLDAALKNVVTADPLYVETLLTTAVLEFSSHAQGAPDLAESGQLSAALKLKLQDFVRERLDHDINLGDLAGVASLSRFHFARSFKVTFGVSPLEYVNRCRAEAAMHLLTTSTLSIAEVARRVGFVNPDRLTVAFKKLTDLTPRQFRQAARS